MLGVELKKIAPRPEAWSAVPVSFAVSVAGSDSAAAIAFFATRPKKQIRGTDRSKPPGDAATGLGMLFEQRQRGAKNEFAIRRQNRTGHFGECDKTRFCFLASRGFATGRRQRNQNRGKARQTRLPQTARHRTEPNRDCDASARQTRPTRSQSIGIDAVADSAASRKDKPSALWMPSG